MSGTKGRSGGARENSGGARPGAGRPPNQPIFSDVPGSSDPKVFLLALMNDAGADLKNRIDAAKALMPFVHQKCSELGKKETQDIEAKKVATGRYAAAQPPRLVSKRD